MTLADARTLLAEGQYTLVAAANGVVYTDKARGVAPLLSLLEGGVSLANGVAADRVVGRAAAYLYCLLGARELYAGVVSTGALEVLAAGGIAVSFGEAVPAIKNRKGDGFCPMETATKSFAPTDKEGALAAILATKARLG